MMQDKDAAKAEQVMAAILTMKKLDLEALRRADRGEESEVAAAR
jgi:hypothetical protein